MTKPSLDQIDILAAGDDEQLRDLRRRINRAGTTARARATRTGNDVTRMIYWTAADAASQWTFRCVSADTLFEVIELLTKLFLVAGLAERLERGDG